VTDDLVGRVARALEHRLDPLFRWQHDRQEIGPTVLFEQPQEVLLRVRLEQPRRLPLEREPLQVRLVERPGQLRDHALEFRPKQVAVAPPVFPSGMLNRATVAAFNEVWFRKAPRERRGEVQSIAAFFHPLDAVSSWNRIYGPKGFLQYQFVVPFGAEGTLRRCIEMLSDAGQASFLAVLKRFGAQGEGHLSFPTPGWTLALDIPLGAPILGGLLDRLDAEVIAAGGREYLAKDSRLSASEIAPMYPGLDEWRGIRKAVDPDGVFTSDLARRLGL